MIQLSPSTRLFTCAAVATLCVIAPTTAFAQSSAEASVTSIIIIVVLSLALFAACMVAYVIPTIIAFRRQHPNRWLIAVINIGLGGTILGWFGALVWALNIAHQSPTGSNGGESGVNIFANDVVPVAVVERPSVAHPGDGRDALASRLVQLKRLLDDGALTAEEYADLRRPILQELAL